MNLQNLSHLFSIHGMVDRKTRLVFYVRNNKTFWKIMPYYNPPASPAQRSCRNAFAEAQRLCAIELKSNKQNQEYWTKMANILNLKSARAAAFAHFYKRSKRKIAKQIRILINKSARKHKNATKLQKDIHLHNIYFEFNNNVIPCTHNSKMCT